MTATETTTDPKYDTFTQIDPATIDAAVDTFLKALGVNAKQAAASGQVVDLAHAVGEFLATRGVGPEDRSIAERHLVRAIAEAEPEILLWRSESIHDLRHESDAVWLDVQQYQGVNRARAHALYKTRGGKFDRESR